MAETQDATLNDVKTIGECNQSMMESMMTILQSILKIERRVGGLESEVRSLRSDMTKMADGRRSGETTTTKPHGHPEVNKEVPDMVELERRLMSKLDVLMTTQGNSSKKINQLVKEVQVLKATDGDMSEKLSGLIRCSAHGSNTERQAVTLEGLKAITERQAVTLEGLKAITERQAVTLEDVKVNTERQAVTLEGVMVNTERQAVTLEGVKVNTERQAVTLEDVKVNTEQHATELSNVNDIVEKVLPQKVKDIMKEELKGQLPKVKKRDEAEGAEPSRYKVRGHFNSEKNYGIYVKQHVRAGMKVRYRSGDGYRGLAMGDVGTVRGLSSNMVSVDWSGHFFTKKVFFYDVELLG